MTTAKAVIGAVVTGLSTVLTALTTGDQHVSAAEWVAAAIATLVAYGALYSTSNKPADDSGESFAGFLYVAALLVFIACGVVWLWKHVG